MPCLIIDALELGCSVTDKGGKRCQMHTALVCTRQHFCALPPWFLMRGFIEKPVAVTQVFARSPTTKLTQSLVLDFADDDVRSGLDSVLRCFPMLQELRWGTWSSASPIECPADRFTKLPLLSKLTITASNGSTSL